MYQHEIHIHSLQYMQNGNNRKINYVKSDFSIQYELFQSTVKSIGIQ